jgi:hypothetical protein
MSKFPPLKPKEAAAALNMSIFTLNRLRRARKLPVLSIGYRSKVYDLDACRAALSKLKIKAL